MTNEKGVIQKFGKNFQKGTILFRDGDLNKEMYVIHSGKVKITKQVGDAKKTLALLVPGDFFGEMATLLDKPRSATAEVVEDSLLIVIAPQTFETMIATDVSIAVKIIGKLASRIWEANEKIESLMLRDNMSRIVHILMQMAETSGMKDGNCVRVNITPKELANEADIDVHVVKDLVERLSQINIITFEENVINIKGIHKLKFLDFLEIEKKSGKI
ncbi:MAG: Crp/Fnr family transcriptional regulator [Deltaproteobacteria bacterium]|nr:Crp/Fnr family transcriptional regulator [Deltaproteobacteria bacterium]